ncbi:MAG TPA: hypothetical protein VJT14_03075 [Candidatus Dormibacteraeota bacterium]|nr:hypothetical protein [Candidatus Dormibacteraeota bacterium]
MPEERGQPRRSGRLRLSDWPILEQDRTDRFQNWLPAIALPNCLNQSFEPLVAGPKKDVLFGLEVAKESSGRHVGLFRNGSNRHPLEAPLAIETHRGIDQGLAGLFFLSRSPPHFHFLRAPSLARATMLH